MQFENEKVEVTVRGLPTKVYLVKAMVFFSSHVWMLELDYKES